MAGTNCGDQWQRPMARTGRKDFRQLRVDHRCPPDALPAAPKGLQISSVGDQGKKEARSPSRTSHLLSGALILPAGRRAGDFNRDFPCASVQVGFAVRDCHYTCCQSGAENRKDTPERKSVSEEKDVLRQAGLRDNPR